MRRRDFLQASAAAAAASFLEACARQEVQYLRQPVERERGLAGLAVWRPGVCQQCGSGCGIRVRTVDGDAKKIEGDPEHPVNRGGLCALGQASLQGLYDPDRIRRPLRRTGPRGEGRFEEVSWEEALGQVGEALAAAQPTATAWITGARRGFVGALWRRLAHALGTAPPAYLEAPEVEVERAAARIALGVSDVPYFDLAASDYVLSLGVPFIDRWSSPVHYARALAEMRRGRPGQRGKLVQAEARMSLTAANADEWLPALPGSEGVLARALAAEIFDGGRVSDDAAARYRTLFPQDPPSLEEAASVCDVPPERIRRVGRELAEAERGVVLAGGSAAAHTNGLANVVAGLGLNLLLGALGRPGGVFAAATFELEEPLEPPASGTTSLEGLVARLRGETDPPVDLLVVSEADPLHALPGRWGVGGGLGRVGTLVALSSFRDDTTLWADVVLPLHTDLERFDCVVPQASVGVGALGLTRPVVEPLGESRHPADVILALARVLGEPLVDSFPWRSYAELVESRIEEEQSRLPGGEGRRFRSYFEAAVARGGIWEEGPPQGVPPGPQGPAPEIEAARFYGDTERYPLTLLLFDSVKTADGRGANRPWLQELPDPLTTVMWDSWIEVSPVDARRLGIETGDQVRVQSPSAAVEVGAVVHPAVRPGLVAIPLGQGYRDFGRYARGRGVNPMELLGSRLVAGTGAPARAATRVRIERLEGGATRPLALFGPGLRQAEEEHR